MTENGKIFLTKNLILNIISEQLLSVGLSLYIIKDILKELELVYNDIINKLLSEKQEKVQEIQEENKLEVIDMTKSGVYPIKWIPDLEEKELNILDQAD